jgi:arylsulfatase A-like enzyme
MYASLPPWRPASYNEAEVSDKPRWIRELPSLTPARRETGDLFRIRQIESLQAVDRAVGELIEALIQTGRYENTIFVFLSDNGLSWGEHRWNMKKWCAYEECIRIPLWVRVPGIAGRDDGSLVNDVDLGPTLAEFAGALPLGELDGLSLVDLIEKPQAPWRTEGYTEFLSPAIKGDQMIFREVRTATATYMEYENGDREFYDLTVDPLQEHNRVDDPEYADKVRDLQKALKILEED